MRQRMGMSELKLMGQMPFPGHLSSQQVISTRKKSGRCRSSKYLALALRKSRLERGAMSTSIVARRSETLSNDGYESPRMMRNEIYDSIDFCSMTRIRKKSR